MASPPARSGGPPAADAERGASVLHELGQASPEDLARRLLKDLRSLEHAEVEDVAQHDLFHAAAALAADDSEERRSLMRAAVRGTVVGLSAEERHTFVHLCLKSWTAAASGPPAAGGGGEEPPVLLRNLAFVASQVPPSPPGEADVLLQSVVNELVSCAMDHPHAVSEIIDECDEKTRATFIKTMPEDQRESATVVLQPGGPVDKLSWWMSLALVMYEQRWVFVVVPSVELLLSFTLSHLSVWLLTDALLNFGAVWAAYRACSCFAVVFKRLRHDAGGTMAELMKAARSSSLQDAAAALSMNVADLECAKLCGVLLVGLFVVGALWSLGGGLYAVYAALTLACSFWAHLSLFAFVALRFCMIAAVYDLYAHVREELQPLRAPGSGDKPSYGSTREV